MQITLQDDHLVIADDGRHLQHIRALPARRWDGLTKSWRCPYVREVYDAMVAAKVFPVHHVARPTESGYSIDRPHGQTFLVIKTLKRPEDVQKCQRIPERRQYSTQWGGWVCKPTKANVQYLIRAFPGAVWSDSAQQLATTFTAERVGGPVQQNSVKSAADVHDFKFPGTPRPHQVTAFSLARGQEAFALFMEQRTGKCYVQICEAMDLVAQSKVTGWLIVSPNSVKDVWVEELEKWLPPEYHADVFVWEPTTRHKAEHWLFKNPPGDRPLKVLIMNVEAFSSPKGVALADLFVSKYPCLMTVDESTRIKTPSAARSKAVVRVGRKAKVRRILTGTPVTQGPLDVFMPFKFLDERILGHGSFYSFRNKYAVMGGFNGKQVMGYVHLDELQALVDRKSYRVLFEHQHQPGYEKRFVTLTGEQQRIYDSMRDNMVAEVASGQKASVQHAITKILRLQQIIGGFLPLDNAEGEAAGTTVGAHPVSASNPKLDELLTIIEDYSTTPKFIIWARFRAELDLIQQTLRARYGPESVVEFHGGVTELQRKTNRRRFQDSADPARFFVGQQQTGGLGIPLYAADVTVFFSNDHSLETRLQAESRPLLPEKPTPHTYIDLIARNTYDSRIVQALRSKKGLADLITGDPTLKWL